MKAKRIDPTAPQPSRTIKAAWSEKRTNILWALVTHKKKALTQTEWSVAIYLLFNLSFGQATAISQKELGAVLGISQPNLSPAMRALAKLGLIARKRKIGTTHEIKLKQLGAKT